MYLKALHINYFRNLSQIRLSLHERLNIIHGENGSGKTSVLEAIYFLSLGRSFRTSQLARIIQQQHEAFQLFVSVHHQQAQTLACQRDKKGKSIAKLDGEKQSSQTALTRALPIQLFNPESFNLINSGAQQRCKLLDWGAFYHDDAFLKLWQVSKRLIKQRNAALKQNYPRSYIEALEVDLSQKAHLLNEKRQAYFKQLAPRIEQILKGFNAKLDIEISYYRGWHHDKTLLEVLKAHYTMDTKTAVTQYGPHRADLRFKVHGHPAQDILSRGQQKLLICALKLAQGEIFAQENKTSCIYLVDDLHSEFDDKHLSYLFNQLIASKGQIIATAIKPQHLQPLLTGLVHESYDIANYH